MWHELMTTDPDAAGTFYSKVLPWKTQASNIPSYTLWYSGKTREGGLMALPEQSAAAGAPPHWLAYIGTPSVDTSVADVQRLGGKVLKSAADIPGYGRFAVVADPQGAAFVLYTPPQSSGGGDMESGPSGFAWHELTTSDVNAALGFYVELFGWEKGPVHDMGDMGPYQLVVHGGKQIGGIFKAPGAGPAPNWLNYMEVADATKAANAAKAAGGRVLNGPMEVPGGGWIAQIMDPQGAMFAVHEAAKSAAAEKPAKAKAAAPKAGAAPKATAPQAAPKTPAPKPATPKAGAASSAAKTPAPKAAVASPPAKTSKPAAAATKATPKRKAAKKAPARKKVASKVAKKAAGKSAKKAAKPAARKAAKKVAKKAAKAKRPATRGKTPAKAKKKAKAKGGKGTRR